MHFHLSQEIYFSSEGPVLSTMQHPGLGKGGW
jgi:hypothetical protein